VNAADVLVALRSAFSERPNWHGFSPRQLAVLIFLHGYTSEPAGDLDVGAALPFALEDFQGAA
jgi:hypothetical protein